MISMHLSFLAKGKPAPAHFEIDSSHVARAFLHVKTYLRSTMTQSRLNLLILHYHKDRTDSLSLTESRTECLQEFADCREGRTDVFGKFK